MILQEGIEYSPSARYLKADANTIQFTQDFWINSEFRRLGDLGLQICWYSMGTSWCKADPHWTWPSGLLYGADSGVSLLGKACSIRAEWLDPNTSTKVQHWTCRVQTSTKDIYDEDLERLVRELLLALPLTICLVTSMVLKRVMVEWESLLRYMESMVDVQRKIVDPDRHDQLLFDDEQFSRSRMYFWMLSSLSAYIQMLEETRLNCENLFELVNRVYPDRTVLDEEERKVLETLDPHMVRLNRTIKRASLLHSRVLALRDGLFNASAVLESRAANRLSKNVRLLTYVSIFYLPLSFCTHSITSPDRSESLWSTTNTFSWPGLVLAMCLTAIATYLVTFNLNQIVRLLSEVYSTFRTGVIDHMANHANMDTSDDGVSSEASTNLSVSRREWIAIAARFRRFKPPKLESQPSEWLILRYIGETTTKKICVFATLRRVLCYSFTGSTSISRSSKTHEEESQCGEDEIPQRDRFRFPSPPGSHASSRATGLSIRTASRSTASIQMFESQSGPGTNNEVGEELPTPSLLHRRNTKEQDLEAGIASRDSAENTAGA
ncbi:hypothetical protein E4T47_06010 [Aureobasidium subglaciale]|nr:hypothetical protein E4T47_06010 [Aureobasidium subglaciale]